MREAGRDNLFTGFWLLWGAYRFITAGGGKAVAPLFSTPWRKLKLEERWMGEIFGDRHAACKREVRGLAPFLA